MPDDRWSGGGWPPSPAWSPAWRLWVLTALAVLAAVVWWNVRQFTTIVVTAVLLAYVLDPLVRWTRRRAMLGRVAATLLVYGAVTGVLAVLAVLLAPSVARQIMDFSPESLRDVWGGVVDALPATVTAFDRTVSLRPMYEELFAMTSRAEEALLGRESLVWLLGFATDFAFTVLGIFFTLVTSLYLSMDAENISRWIAAKVPPGYEDAFRAVQREIDAVWQAFFRGQLVLVAVIAVSTTVGLLALGVAYAVPLGLIAGALEVVPRVGPTVAVIPAVMIALVQPSATMPDLPKPWFVLLVVGLYVVIQQIENNVLVPRVIGSRVKLPPAVVLVGALMGASLAGVIGILLAPPVMGTLRIVGSWLYAKLSGTDGGDAGGGTAVDRRAGEAGDDDGQAAVAGGVAPDPDAEGHESLAPVVILTAHRPDGPAMAWQALS